MRIGVVFPQTEVGSDPRGIRLFATEAERLGFAHLAAYDHVVGADRTVHEGWRGLYDSRTEFHEPMVLFGYLAALTELELVSKVIVLPQRQTVLVAKQAAEVDLLTEGRTRLGVGLGWNRVEYEALGADFDRRGDRIAEQVGLLRRLWCEPSVTHHGPVDTVIGAGLAPLPVQRPIPIWFGARTPAALRRAGMIADGWFPLEQPGAKLDGAMAHVSEAALSAGRDAKSIGMEGQVTWRSGERSRLLDDVAGWDAAGASHLSISTMNGGLSSANEHSLALSAIVDALSDL